MRLTFTVICVGFSKGDQLTIGTSSPGGILRSVRVVIPGGTSGIEIANVKSVSYNTPIKLTGRTWSIPSRRGSRNDPKKQDHLGDRTVSTGKADPQQYR